MHCRLALPPPPPRPRPDPDPGRRPAPPAAPTGSWNASSRRLRRLGASGGVDLSAYAVIAGRGFHLLRQRRGQAGLGGVPSTTCRARTGTPRRSRPASTAGRWRRRLRATRPTPNTWIRTTAARVPGGRGRRHRRHALHGLRPGGDLDGGEPERGHGPQRYLPAQVGLGPDRTTRGGGRAGRRRGSRSTGSRSASAGRSGTGRPAPMPAPPPAASRAVPPRAPSSGSRSTRSSIRSARLRGATPRARACAARGSS